MENTCQVKYIPHFFGATIVNHERVVAQNSYNECIDESREGGCIRHNEHFDVVGTYRRLIEDFLAIESALFSAFNRLLLSDIHFYVENIPHST